MSLIHVHQEIEGRLRARAEAAEAQVAQLQARVAELETVIEFYGDPDTYVAIGFFPDPPCGDFINDLSEVQEESGLTVVRPGKRARAALQRETSDVDG